MKPGSGRPDEQDHDGTMWLVMAGCIMVAVVIVAMEIMAIWNIAEAGPVVGDIVAFHQAGAGIDEDPITVSFAAAPTDRTCVLSPRVMRADGGSLVVEEGDKPDRLYRVHWAGAHTADGTGDCGAQADLMISASNLRALASATGQLGPDGRIAAKL